MAMLKLNRRLCIKIFGLLRILIFLNFFQVEASFTCPYPCFCNKDSRIVYCSRKNLAHIPSGIPDNSLQINLNDNNFQVTTIQRRNFSSFVDLEHLYLSGCGIESIEVDTFIDLEKLKWLDLSRNSIRIIQDFAFRGLNLEHLFLNGNRDIQLSRNAFQDLRTTGLRLQRCSLTRLSVAVISPLSDSLESLWLDGNHIESLNPALLVNFSKLKHLRLGNNPLHCNCEMKWFADFFDTHPNVFSGARPPHCASPERLRDKTFDTLPADAFLCNAPVFSSVDVTFDEDQGTLKCIATGDPAPTLYWIKSSGDKLIYFPPGDRKMATNTAVLQIPRPTTNLNDKYAETFVCLASNAAGNVTFTFNVTLPEKTVTTTSTASTTISTTTNSSPSKGDIDDPMLGIEPDFSSNEKQTRRTSHNGDTNTKQTPIVDIPHETKADRDQPSYHFPNSDENDSKISYGPTGTTSNHRRYMYSSEEKYFRLHDIIAAVAGTFACTVLLCCLFICIICQVKKKVRRRRENKEDYKKHNAQHQKAYLAKQNNTRQEMGAMPELVEFLEVKENRENHYRNTCNQV
ncbi:leucine-rich repeat and fibronectin type III domain-containing protein 1-like protein [Lingula anatina]|uniref:Leucine-rich repeat and fibronectin type III domain-containing protein 1-like protein n=1 Tax=Lingula anatina TaxID=7574 RepID=A0A1S3INI0_LINAN|nr:leucine-rich repeat and fibronectin type III domain-containing protein 1-like protein [Lingula anatina]XP_013399456.1 leucine-rich repeat and fibronectin type III domain-containing protein 1-like protein [Lingula anatina]XP_013399457.1 leucine-rich repeat and fibronectin type III domain-containing protein 1-like protein [Lingula anatina]XP_013399458.1 leucine-rich repeat and fibronectin type III domain-containing protein 1-like protein [Lingula anatina]XP_013399459.1 leucine-rich repeat and |eukprot:XP_013399455.1 leucine-rich repeat and fibronectin type III domain-containing protein 1-like protein [Lingula anatina]